MKLYVILNNIMYILIYFNISYLILFYSVIFYYVLLYIFYLSIYLSVCGTGGSRKMPALALYTHAEVLAAAFGSFMGYMLVYTIWLFNIAMENHQS